MKFWIQYTEYGGTVPKYREVTKTELIEALQNEKFTLIQATWDSHLDGQNKLQKSKMDSVKRHLDAIKSELNII